MALWLGTRQVCGSGCRIRLGPLSKIVYGNEYVSVPSIDSAKEAQEVLADTLHGDAHHVWQQESPRLPARILPSCAHVVAQIAQCLAGM